MNMNDHVAEPFRGVLNAFFAPGSDDEARRLTSDDPGLTPASECPHEWRAVDGNGKERCRWCGSAKTVDLSEP